MLSPQEILSSLSEDDIAIVLKSINARKNELLTVDLITDIVTPNFIGPVWKKDCDGEWVLPEHTLGWDVAGWCTKWLRDPNDSSKPWIFTDEQLRFVLWWYAIDETGEWIYNKGVLQRRKGWGKDPLLAALSIAEMVGPVRFSHFREDGSVAGKSCHAALVQVTAVVQSQTSNTSDMFKLMMSNELIAQYGITPGIEIIRALGGTAQIQMVTSSYRAIEGKRATFALLNESHHMVASNGGLKLYQTVNGNAAKLGNRYLAITNAYVPGDGGVDAGGSEAEQGSVAEKMREAWQAEEDGRAIKTGFFYDSVEASARAPLGGPLVPHIVERMIGDSKWTKVRDVISSINDLSMPAERSRRMWYNQVVADTESLYTPEIIAAAQVENAELRKGDQIVLGLDGGLTDDSTALVAIRTTDKTVFVLGCWGRWEDDGHEGYIVDQERVSDVIDIAHDMYDVVGFISDVEHWETYVNRWTELYAETYRVKAKGVDSIKLDMRGNKERLTRANESLIAAIMGKDLRLDTDVRLKRHLMNVRRRENKWGVGFGKESRESRKKVDIYAALLLAYEALVLFKTRPIDKKPEYGTTGYFF